MSARQVWPVCLLLACSDPQAKARRTALEDHRREAVAAIARGDLKRAAFASDAAVDAAPESWEARALRLEMRAAAMARFPERAVEPRPDELDYRIESHLRTGASPRAPWLVARAHLAMKRRDVAAATAFAKEAMAAGDAPGLAWLVQARLELATGRSGEAEASLRRSREADPTDTEAARLLAGLLLRRGDATGAAALLEPLVTATAHAAAIRTYGIALFSQGKVAASGAALERARALDGDDPETHRAIADWHLAGGRLDEAAAAYERVTQLGDVANGRYGLAVVAVKRREVEGAVRAFETLLSGPVPRVGAYFEAAQVFEAGARRDEAARAYRRFIEVGGRDPASAADVATAQERLAALAPPPIDPLLPR